MSFYGSSTLSYSSSVRKKGHSLFHQLTRYYKKNEQAVWPGNGYAGVDKKKMS